MQEASIESALQTIADGLIEIGRHDTLDLLRPGIPAGHVRSALEARRLFASEDLVSLYGWRDGTNAHSGTLLDDMHLFPGFYFAPLAEALTNHEAFTADPRWNPDWLPVFANGGGDFLAVTCSADPHYRGRVRHFRIDEQVHPLEFLSVADLAATVAAAYRENVYLVDEHGYLEMDDEAFADLAHRLNPDVPWWRD